MKKIASMKYHVHIMLFSKTHHLVEGFPAIILAGGIAFVITNMTVSGDEDADCIRT